MRVPYLDFSRAAAAEADALAAAFGRVHASGRYVLGPEVEALQPGTVDPPAHPRRLRKQLTWLFLRPGRLDRTEI